MHTASTLTLSCTHKRYANGIPLLPQEKACSHAMMGMLLQRDCPVDLHAPAEAQPALHACTTSPSGVRGCECRRAFAYDAASISNVSMAMASKSAHSTHSTTR